MISNLRHKRKSSLENNHITTTTTNNNPISTLTKRFRGIAYDG